MLVPCSGEDEMKPGYSRFEREWQGRDAAATDRLQEAGAGDKAAQLLEKGTEKESGHQREDVTSRSGATARVWLWGTR